MSRASEVINHVAQRLPAAVRAGGAVLLSGLLVGYGHGDTNEGYTDPHPVTPEVETTTPQKDGLGEAFAHQRLEHGYRRVTFMDKWTALSFYPDVRPLRVMVTKEGNFKPYWGPVKEGSFKEADIHARAAEIQQLSDKVNIENCATKRASTPGASYPQSNFGYTDGFTAYAEAKGYTREIPVSYTSGDQYFHADIGDVPSTVDHRDEIFVHLNGKNYPLEGELKYMPYDDATRRENLRLKVPAETDTPPPIDFDRFRC